MSARPPRHQNAPPAVVGDVYVVSSETDSPEYDGPALPSPAPFIDPRELGLHREQPPRDVPYLPTDQHVVNKMMEMAKVGKDDVLYDLGCGDGRICITAAKLGARAVGVEIDLVRLRECHDNLRNMQLKERVEFRRQSFFDVDLRPATVVALYLLPAINRLLRPKLLYELRAGARIIANQFAIADWVPDDQIMFKHRPVMLWIVPAWVEGTYKCLLRTHSGVIQHGMLVLRRNIQFVSGEFRVRRKVFPVTGRIRGTKVALTFVGLAGSQDPVVVEGVYDDGRARKTTAVMSGGFKCGADRGMFFAARIENPGAGQGNLGR